MVLYPIMLFSQFKTSDKCIVSFENYPNENLRLQFENDSLSISFIPASDFWKVKIKNKTDYVCSLNWNDVIFAINGKSGNIAFSDDTRLTMRNEKPTLKIIPQTYLEKKITPIYLVKESSIGNIYKPKDLKKYGDVFCQILIPVSFGDKTFNYIFKFKISYTG